MKLAIYDDSNRLVSLQVRAIDTTRIMIEGDTESILYLSECIKQHAINGKTCELDVPLLVNFVSHPLDCGEFNLFLHRLPCDELQDPDLSHPGGQAV